MVFTGDKNDVADLSSGQTKEGENIIDTEVLPEETVKVVSVDGGAFYFNPNEIVVKKGNKVKVIFSNVEGMHDFAIDEFNVKTERINAGQTTTVEFTASEAGIFEYYCSVGDHRAKGMRGTLIVEE